MSEKIICHHVGGRGFGVSFNAPPLFWDDVTHVLYEADQENVENMIADERHPQRKLLGSNFFIAPFCLGDERRQAKLRVTANAFASSLLEPSADFFQYYCEVPVPPTLRDFTYHDMLKVVKEVDVDVVPLDELLGESRPPFREPPDFLSIDTQGYEFSIIKGAKRAIVENVMGMVVEVEIKEMYVNQPRLGDILHLLEEFGFHFAGFAYLQEVSTFRGPIGFRGKGFPAFGDALFLRKTNDPAILAGSSAGRYRKLRKLAFIAINFGHVEYGLDALLKAESLRDHLEVRPARDCRYDAFLDEVLTIYRSAPAVYPRFVGIPEDARAEPNPEGAAQRDRKAAPHAVMPNDAHSTAANSTGRRVWRWIDGRAQRDERRIWELASISPVTAICKMIVYSSRYLRRHVKAPPSQPPAVNEAPDPAARDRVTNAVRELPPIDGHSAFEQLLIANGFDGVAGVVRSRRVAFEAAVRAEGPSPGDGPDFGPEAVARGTSVPATQRTSGSTETHKCCAEHP